MCTPVRRLACGNYFANVFFSGSFSLPILSHDWLPTVQLVLHADWQVLLHSPQPVTFLSAGCAIVFILFIAEISFRLFYTIIIYCAQNCKHFLQIAPKAKGFFGKCFSGGMIPFPPFQLRLRIKPASAPLIPPASAPHTKSMMFPQPKEMLPAIAANRR